MRSEAQEKGVYFIAVSVLVGFMAQQTHHVSYSGDDTFGGVNYMEKTRRCY